MSALVASVMNGARFIDPGSAKLDVSTANNAANGDYKNLFALYQGVNALEGLAAQMAAKGVSAADKARIQTAFNTGMKQLQSFLAGGSNFQTINVVQGAASALSQTKVGAPVESDTYTTAVLHTGAASDPVAAFQGPVQFSVTALKTSKVSTTVNFNLDDMTVPRTMSNVVGYLNGKLKDAGLDTRFGVVDTPGVAQTVKENGKTVTLSTPPDSFSLKIKGDATETLTFGAPAATPAVYVSQTSGLTDGKTPDAINQMLKYQTDPAGGATDAATGQVFSKTLPSAVQDVKASATAPDGSLYVLANVDATVSGQTIKGDQDVALMKYDSAGNLIYTRTLGAADSASGYALTVSADGKKVAVGGSVTGAFDANDPTDTATTGADSFVSLYNSDGDELWTQRRGSAADDHVNALAIGADGTVYVAGTAGAAMSGATSKGGQDAYLSAIGTVAAKDTDGDPITTPKTLFTTQYGTSGTDQAAGIALSGSSVIVAGQEGSHAVVRSFDLQPSGAPILDQTRDLGDLKGGQVTGVGIADEGSVIVAGATHNAALDAGTITSAYTEAKDAFVARLSGDLVASASDALTYYGGATDTTASAMTVSGGSVFITGQVTVTPPPGQTTAANGYAAQIDPTTGAVTWSQQFTGLDRTAAPTSIAVAATGSSVLDRLGLPQGTIDYNPATLVVDAVPASLLVDNTSLRPGDQFYVSAGLGPKKAVTIDANDTLKSLGVKINRALGFVANVTTVTVNGQQQLKIVPINVRTRIQLSAGADDRNALPSLGLAEGVISTAPTTTKINGKTVTTKKNYALQLPSTLGLGSTDDIAAARKALTAAASTIRGAYRDMITPPSTATTAAATGPAPAYITAQIANYQQALARLTGGSS